MASTDEPGAGDDRAIVRSSHGTGGYLRLDEIAASAEPRPVLQLALRLIWFAVAGGVGALWIYSEQITGRPLPVHAHLVFGALFVVAIASGGYDLRAFVLWRRELARLGTNLELSPKHVQDASVLLQAIIEQRPDALRAIRKELER